MADDALNPQTEDDQEIVDVDDENPSEEEEQQSPEQFEIVEGEGSDSQPEKKAGGGVRRLVRRLSVAKEQVNQTSAELEAEREKNKLLMLALEQQKEESDQPPDPMDFDDGIADPKYIKAWQEHQDKVVARAVEKATSSLPVKQQPVVKPDLEGKQQAHGERALKLGIDDYAEVQDAAIEVLGVKTANDIIALSDKSELILYHLGKNPSRAEDFRDLVERDVAGAVKEIGRLEEALKVRPRATTQPAHDPDEEVRGSSSSRKGLRGPPGAKFE